MIWIAIAAAALCGFCLPLGLGAVFDRQDNPLDTNAAHRAGAWLGASIIFGLAAVLLGFSS